MDVAFAVGRGLCLREARQSSLVNAAKLAVDIGGLHLQVLERGDSARILRSQVEPDSGEQSRAAVVDPRGHPIAVELDLVQPLEPRGRLLNRLGKLERNEGGQGARLDASGRS
jgi:hypothetical protein